MENKIKEEQLSKIKEQQDKLRNLVSDVGILESQKHGLLHDIAILNGEISDFKTELEKEYGAIEVDITNGSFKKIDNKEKELVEEDV